MSLRQFPRCQERILKILGWLSITVFALLLLAWLQNSDPDYLLSTGVSLQLRMCSDELSGSPPGRSPILLPLSLLALGAGVGLLKLGGASEGKPKDDG